MKTPCTAAQVGEGLCRDTWTERAEEGELDQRCLLGAWGLTNQNHAPESSLEFWRQVSGAITLPERTIWSNPCATALGSSAAKLDNTGLFYFYCPRAQGEKFNSRVWVQHRGLFPLPGHLVQNKKEKQVILSQDSPPSVGGPLQLPRDWRYKRPSNWQGWTLNHELSHIRPWKTYRLLLKASFIRHYCTRRIPAPP